MYLKIFVKKGEKIPNKGDLFVVDKIFPNTTDNLWNSATEILLRSMTKEEVERWLKENGGK